jgi:hypothetical protein
METYSNLYAALGRIVAIDLGGVRHLDCIDRKLCNPASMRYALILDQIGGCHKRVSNRFDFEDVVQPCELVEPRIQSVQQVCNFFMTQISRHCAEANDITEEYGDALVLFLRNPSTLSERICNVRWENVIQQCIVLPAMLNLGVCSAVVAERLRQHVSSDDTLQF